MRAHPVRLLTRCLGAPKAQPPHTFSTRDLPAWPPLRRAQIRNTHTSESAGAFFAHIWQKFDACGAAGTAGATVAVGTFTAAVAAGTFTAAGTTSTFTAAGAASPCFLFSRLLLVRSVFTLA
eukprot:CAMPEP_0174896092 /NCGR_PEP_ID=MMETSP0167-20121228/10342_1 /TAXON_ID=38298 /ORGANISM="Rhodella maculata, Strain CCMP736" /LENGTH=121 /DNA_ID=CAMNT_0016135563 /DNA_START=420 /DNA_END=786 /DNA_ORIENTATION=+